MDFSLLSLFVSGIAFGGGLALAYLGVLLIIAILGD